ncbi:DUF4253 domain-containing protein [Streptomyces sp. CBMA123]|uniref:DUF4253 domain-containing protein n=1 Tax=Streptomyces sp. CBMA123 TaxID=1896313 RepID=UPI001661CB28|nr:DUF4253 domain-containing protein [Streptomyces sp. CBMA123]MBD0693784.1 hypothetical protein [Streptomyces sp. CBMA123]
MTSGSKAVPGATGPATVTLAAWTPEALPPAAEHAAFRPDRIHRGAGSLTAYAEQSAGSHQGHFWWD